MKVGRLSHLYDPPHDIPRPFAVGRVAFTVSYDACCNGGDAALDGVRTNVGAHIEQVFAVVLSRELNSLRQ